ncbi:MAG: NUDIX domain-containing protein [Actinomycetota bacterium]|nr:NUDIX domain-containing protein [Actinomycetota bacterium]
MDEKIDVLDERGEKTGRVVWKSEAHRVGLWHRCFHLWIVDPGDDMDGPFLFVQRRASVKETWPDKLDVTAAGHLMAGESGLDGLREVEEELGLSVGSGDVVALGTRRNELEIPAGMDREFQDVFLLVRRLEPSDLRLQREEVASVARLRLGDVEGLCGGEPVPVQEWADGEVRESRARIEDFVSGEDGYLMRIVRASRKALAGEGAGETF